jgi:glycosyltransferase involved in cell wall biosynthesis
MEDKKITIAVAMIVKNELEHLERALESAKEADAIYVCDTGSTDGGATVMIAKKFTNNVCEEYKWEDSFCKARNHVKSHVKEDWIFSLDADEYIHDFSKVREAVAAAEIMGIKAIDITQVAEDSLQENAFPRLFKNIPEVYWNGAIHNHLSVVGTKVGDVRLTYGYSLAHFSDPERTLRILEKEVKGGTGGAREMYYLGREYYYRQRFGEATSMLGKYVQISQFLPEKADGFLMMARCYWAQRLANDARDACAQALILNANFKEALLFMAELSWPKNANKWKEYAALADNSDVLFIRTK